MFFGLAASTPELRSTHLHDKLPASWQASFRNHGVLGLLLLLSLLDLSQAADGIHPLAVLGAGLQLLA